MADSDNYMFRTFVREYGGNGNEMNSTSGIVFLTRNVNRDESIAGLCTSVENLFQGSGVVKEGNLKWVACGGQSNELYLCEDFLDAGRQSNESELHGYLDHYSMRGLPKVVHYVPPVASTSDPLSQTKKPYLICPPGYEDAVVLIRAFTDIEQYLPVYEVQPSTTIQEIKDRGSLPGRWAITLNNILVVPHKSKIEWPPDHEMKFVCQIYSTGEPRISSMDENDVCPFMRRFWGWR